MTGVPPALAGVIDRLLRKSPADRYPTAAATREALERALTADRAAAPTGSARRRRTPFKVPSTFPVTNLCRTATCCCRRSLQDGP
jgi:hypothetical protein